MIKIILKSGHQKQIRLHNRVLEKFRIRSDEYRIEIHKDRIIFTHWDGKYWVMINFTDEIIFDPENEILE